MSNRESLSSHRPGPEGTVLQAKPVLTALSFCRRRSLLSAPNPFRTVELLEQLGPQTSRILVPHSNSNHNFVSAFVLV